MWHLTKQIRQATLVKTMQGGTKYFRTKADAHPSVDYHTVYDYAYDTFRRIKARTRRRPYVRSKYFHGQKIFLGQFWEHLHRKNWRERLYRLRFYKAALELIQLTLIPPMTKENIDNKSELLHRFNGVTKNGAIFFVQIKEDKNNDQKFLISIFPER